MKDNNPPSLFSFSLAYVVATVLFGLVLSIILSQTVTAQEGATGQRGHERSEHRGYRHERLSPEERQARMDAKFSEIDSNSDDMITEEELAAAELPHPRRGKGRHSGRRERNSDTSNTEKHAEMQGKLFESMDSNADGTLSKEEFAGIHAARKSMIRQHMFQRMDNNEDGFLSRDEFPPGRRS